MREFHYEISAKLLGIVFENQQPIFSRNKRGERTRGFDQRKGQITRGINRWFGVFLNRHMGKARFVKSCYWPNGKIVRDQEKFNKLGFMYKKLALQYTSQKLFHNSKS